MKKQIALFLLTVVFVNGNAQDTIILKQISVKNNLTVKLSNSHNRTFYRATPSGYKDPFFRINMANFRIEANYGFFNFLEIGSYYGYSRMGYQDWSSTNIIPELHYLEYWALSNFGGQANFHPFALFPNKIRTRTDLWISYKYGIAVEHGKIIESDNPDIIMWRHRAGAFSIENGLGIGICHYPFRKLPLGFYFEYSNGNWELKHSRRRFYQVKTKHTHDFRWGVSYKFSSR